MNSRQNFNRSNMAQPRPGEVWFVKNLEFEGGGGGKNRPVVIISCQKSAVICCKCTTRFSGNPNLCPILDLDLAGLGKETLVDVTRLTLDKSKLLHKIGDLSDEDRDNIGI